MGWVGCRTVKSNQYKSAEKFDFVIFITKKGLFPIFGGLMILRAKPKTMNKALPFWESEHAATAKVNTEIEWLNYFQPVRKVTIYVAYTSNLWLFCLLSWESWLSEQLRVGTSTDKEAQWRDLENAHYLISLPGMLSSEKEGTLLHSKWTPQVCQNNTCTPAHYRAPTIPWKAAADQNSFGK